MRRLVTVLLACVLMITLAGCHLRHEMKPATCTEPSTCSVCGKTEGEPLGHTAETDPAVEATCTEAGLTEGSHCSVCGEILSPQTEIPALGHDWEEASFASPKTCRRCGATEGEGLGSALFVQALNPGTEKEEAPVLKSFSAPENGETKLFKTIRVNADCTGFDEIDEIVSAAELTLTVEAPEEGSTVIGAALSGLDAEPLRFTLALDGQGITFALPGKSDESWHISYEALQELLGLQPALSRPGALATQPDEEAAARLREMLVRYEEILFSVFDLHNTTEKWQNYRLEALGESQRCLVLNSQPDVSDWRAMLRELLRTAREDEELEALIRQGAETAYLTGQSGGLSMSREQYLAYTMDQFHTGLDDALASVNELAEELAKLRFELAWHAGRVYALKVTDAMNSMIGYESFGSADRGREDVIIYRSYGDEFRLLNTLKTENGRTTGEFRFDEAELSFFYTFEKNAEEKPRFDLRLGIMGDSARLTLKDEGEDVLLTGMYDSYDSGAALRVRISDGEEHVTLPAGEIREIRSEADFEAAMNQISMLF